MKTGELIKKYRKEKKITQQELANLINKSKSTIEKYESNKIESIPVNTLIDISKALGINSMDLIEEKEREQIKSISKKASIKINNIVKSIILGDNYICETNMCKDENFSNETEESIKYIENIYKNAFKPYRNIIENTQNLPDEAIKEVEEFTKYIKYKYSNKEGE